MKLLTALAMVVALLAAPVTNAAAGTFALWDNFPKDINGQDSFYAAGFNTQNPGLFDLPYVSDYNFGTTGELVVKRTGTYPVLLLQSYIDATNNYSAVYYGVPPEALSLHATGQFDLAGTTSAHVWVGMALVADPTQRTKLFEDDLTTSHTQTSFDLLIPYIDPSYALAFSVSGESSGASAYLQGSITDSPVPLPGALLLFGSGLLGLAGWRRKFRN